MIGQFTTWLRRRDRAVTSVETALLLPGILLPLTFGIIFAGAILWAQSALQSTAEIAARCGAIGSPNCSGGTSGVQSYAVSTASTWLFSGVITTSNVKVNSAATNCTAVSGNVEIVEISTSYFASGVLPSSLAKTIDVCAYYPKCATC